MTFTSTELTKTGEGTFALKGNLTILDITKEMTLDVDHGGSVVGPYGQKKAGFEISGSINRKEFGLKWSAITEAGSVVVADFVKLDLNVQVVQQ